MRLHGGKLSVHSDGEGQGSTFTMELPLASKLCGNSLTDLSSSRVRPYHSPATNKAIQLVHSSEKSSPSEDTRISNSKLNVNEIDIKMSDQDDRSDHEYQELDNKLTDRSIVTHHSPDDNNNNFINETCKSFILLRILIVDDSASIRKMLCRVLSRSRVTSFLYDCEEAVDGADALEKIRQLLNTDIDITETTSLKDCISTGDGESSRASQLYDVVLMDYSMPILSGPEATKKLREIGYKDPIIGLTGYTDDEERNIFLESGANIVLTKPLDMKELGHYLEGIIDKTSLSTNSANDLQNN